ncbi:MAG: MFS transporter [Anaerolineae bacterium]|nr:MFS transporter [Anaerolineae bacterium]
MLKIRTQISEKWKHLQADSPLRRRAWKGAAWGLVSGLAAVTFITAYNLFFLHSPLTFFVGMLALLALLAAFGGLATLALRLANLLPAFYITALVAATGLTLLLGLLATSVIIGLLAITAGGVLVLSLIGACIAILLYPERKGLTKTQQRAAWGGLALAALGLLAGLIWLLWEGSPAQPPLKSNWGSGTVAALELDDPSTPGQYAVKTLTYGSGDDRRRPEFATEAGLVTPRVDGSKFLKGWSFLRTAYWGFGPDALPLNGRVWYPQGKGPFPLVLLVHGNHFMEDVSDTGYDYLGALFASRGFIAVSVDENFLNLSPTADVLFLASLKEENDGRAWLLLEHLKMWRGWNETPGNPFYHRVDLGRIALIGHSRGGEAVVAAAVFSQLSHYPGDASISFDYNFNIRAVAAIAPVDGTYQPSQKPLQLENINYFVMHGAQDMDVITFMGARQYARVQFTDGQPWFKAGLYLYGANHGQFNTRWGRLDMPRPVAYLFNTRQLIPPEDQQQVARVYLSAFLEAALNGQTGYLPLFRDGRAAPGWLPETLLLNQYADARTTFISRYEEDVDPGTTTLPGGVQTSQNLTIWREAQIPSKWGSTGNTAVYLGWDNTAASSDAGSYTIYLPVEGFERGTSGALVFSLADANENPNPEALKATAWKRSEFYRQPIDLTIEAIDARGNSARLPLSRVALLQPQIEGRIAKASWMGMHLPASEVVLRYYEFPLNQFSAANPAFDAASLAAIRFTFDRTKAGVVVLDDLGIRWSR